MHEKHALAYNAAVESFLATHRQATRAMAKVERVLIVGGGLAGLALMIALRQRGLSAAIVEEGSDRTAPGTGPDNR
jgi:NADPH-dependent 2,4-dienoyl-CoA reductase/sulfur reductase-like enzyme